MVDPFPSSAEEAKRLGRTFFMGNVHCPIHNIRARWTDNRMCMACADIEGNALVVRAEHEPEALPKETSRAPVIPLPEMTEEQKEEFRFLQRKNHDRYETLRMMGLLKNEA